MDHNTDYTSQIREYFHQEGKLINATKDTFIIRTGDTKDNIYYVDSGYIRIYQINPRGDEFTHIIYGPGEVLPLSWLTKQQQSLSQYRSLTDTVVYAVPAATFTRAMLDSPKLAYGMLQQTLEQYRIFTMRVNNLEYKYASERLAYRLIFLANRFGKPTAAGVVIQPPLTHMILASSLNLSRESVSREIEKIARKGLVSYTPQRQIVIHDMAALAAQEHVPQHQGLPSGIDEFNLAPEPQL